MTGVFQAEPHLVKRLTITIESMLTLPADTAGPVFGWLTALPYPWTDAQRVVASAPPIEPGADHVLAAPRRAPRRSHRRHGMKYRLAAFDFDGTLADTLPWFESVMDGVADKYGFRKASAADKAQLRHRSTREIMAFLEVPVWKLPAIMAHVRQLMREIDPAVRMFAGVPAALAQLKAAGLRLAVCSSNSLDNVRRVLGPQTGALIDDYECGADLFGKPAKLARLMARHGVERTRCILIGDEMRDIDAARKAGVMAGSVAWGYNHVDALRARAPDEIFEQVADLAAVLAPGFPSFPPTP